MDDVIVSDNPNSDEEEVSDGERMRDEVALNHFLEQHQPAHELPQGILKLQFTHSQYGEGEVVPDELYNEEKDDEDEAWVYKNLRGGVEEDITLQIRGFKDNDRRDSDGGEGEEMGATVTKSVAALKPRDR